MTAKIILLNGVGSAGKSSIARALQTITAEPFLHVQMDAFIDMLPEALQDHADGFSYEPAGDGDKPCVVIRTGPVGARALRGMRHAIVAMARQGNNLIVDDVLCNGEMPDYLELLSAFDLHLVGVFAPLEVLEAREVQRADRLPGLALAIRPRAQGHTLRPRSRHQRAFAAGMRPSHTDGISVIAGTMGWPGLPCL